MTQDSSKAPQGHTVYTHPCKSGQKLLFASEFVTPFYEPIEGDDRVPLQVVDGGVLNHGGEGEPKTHKHEVVQCCGMGDHGKNVAASEAKFRHTQDIVDACRGEKGGVL